HPCAHAADRSLSARRDDQDQRPLERDEMSLNRRLAPLVPAEEPVNLSQLRPHPEEPERSEGVSKDGRELELAAMVRDGALRAPPHHEAEPVGSLILRCTPASVAALTSRRYSLPPPPHRSPRPRDPASNEPRLAAISRPASSCCRAYEPQCSVPGKYLNK